MKTILPKLTNILMLTALIVQIFNMDYSNPVVLLLWITLLLNGIERLTEKPIK